MATDFPNLVSAVGKPSEFGAREYLPFLQIMGRTGEK